MPLRYRCAFHLEILKAIRHCRLKRH